MGIVAFQARILGSRSATSGLRITIPVAGSISEAFLLFSSAISVGSFFRPPQTPEIRASRRGPCHTLFGNQFLTKNCPKSVNLISQTSPEQDNIGFIQGLGGSVLVCECCLGLYNHVPRVKYPQI